MAKYPTDIQIVEGILNDMEGQKNQLKADRIVRVLGKRIRQRARGREDFSQSAVRIVREGTQESRTRIGNKIARPVWMVVERHGLQNASCDIMPFHPKGKPWQPPTPLRPSFQAMRTQRLPIQYRCFLPEPHEPQAEVVNGSLLSGGGTNARGRSSGTFTMPSETLA